MGGLIKDEVQKVFDLSLIGRGDCIHIKRKGDTTARNGFVTEARKDRLTVLYCNVRNNACSYINITAEDVEMKAWDVYWTRDFQTVYHEGDEG